MLFHHLYLLSAYLIEWGGAELHLAEVDMLKVKTADAAVVHCAVVDALAPQIGGYRPLCSAWDVGHRLAFGKLNTDGDVEVVEDMKRLHHSLGGGGQRGGCGLEESGAALPHKRVKVKQEENK